MPQEQDFGPQIDAFKALSPEERTARLKRLTPDELKIFEQHVDAYTKRKAGAPATPATPKAPAAPTATPTATLDPTKHYSRAELIRVYRAQHPDTRNMTDNEVFAKRIAVELPAAAQGITELGPQKTPYTPPGTTTGGVGLGQAAEVPLNFAMGVAGLPVAIGMGEYSELQRRNLPTDVQNILRTYEMIQALRGTVRPPLNLAKQAIEVVQPGLVNAPAPESPESKEETAFFSQLLGGEVGGATIGALRSRVRQIGGKVGRAATGQMIPDVEIRRAQEFEANRATAEAKQTEAQVKQAEANRKATEAARLNNIKEQQKYLEEAEKARREAEEAAKKKQEAEKIIARRSQLETTLREGSPRLQKFWEILDGLLNTEADKKYRAIEEKTAKDPGVEGTELTTDVENAKNMLMGSQENLTIFNSILSRSDIAQVWGGRGTDAPPIAETTVSFPHLRGFSSELGKLLERGTWNSDVYNALKYLKDRIDTHKATIAERNGVGPALEAADSFYHDYLKVLWDENTALGKVRLAVKGEINPSEFFDIFMRSKADEASIRRLRELKTEHASTATEFANFLDGMKAAQTELEATPKAKLPPEQPTPTGPTSLPPRPQLARKAGQPLEPQPEHVIGMAKEVPKEKFPTVEEFMQQRLEKTGQVARSWRRMTHYDQNSLMRSIGRLTVGQIGGIVLDTPFMRRLVASPSADMMTVLEHLNEPERSTFAANLQTYIDRENAAGRRLSIGTAMAHFLALRGRPGQRKPQTPGTPGTPATPTAPAENRADAMMRLLGRDKKGKPLNKPQSQSAPAAQPAPTFAPTTVAAATGGPQPTTPQDLSGPIEVTRNDGKQGYISAGAFDPAKYTLKNEDDAQYLPAGGPTMPDDFYEYGSAYQTFTGGQK